MRLLRNLALCAFLAVTALSTLSGCKKDDAECPLGYEGKDCKTESRAKFLGSWAARDEIGTKVLIYPVVISAGSSINTVIIGGISKDFFDNNVVAVVSNDGTFTINEQSPDANGDYKISGTAEFSADKIYINYSLIEKSTGDVNNYSGTWE